MLPLTSRILNCLAAGLLALGLQTKLCAVPFIAELMASNSSTIADQDGGYSSWVEIYNPDTTSDTLTGWYLTNSATSPTKWKFPVLTLPPGARVIIFCSAKNYVDATQPLATNFQLSSGGGYIGLVQSDAATVASSLVYPAQYPDISYGVSQPTAAGEQQQVGYFANATPGTANGNYTNILLADQVTISAAAGLFTGTKTVNLSGGSGTEHIRYILISPSANGDASTVPTASSPLYTSAISISTSQLLRAAVFSADDTQRGLPTTAMYIAVDNSTSNRVDTFSSILPLVVFDDNGRGPLPNNRVFYPAWLGAFTPAAKGTAAVTQTPDFFTPTTMKVHGFSSATWPKQSYESALANDLGANAPRSFFSMSSDKSWDNISCWSIDLTYIHNSFVYSLARGMGYWAPQTRLAEMFIHSQGGPLDYTSYAGITNMSERIKVEANRVNIYSIQPSDVTAPNVTGGYVLKFDHPEDTVNYYNFTTTRGTLVMVENPGKTSMVKAQSDYISGYVQQMENAMAADQANGYTTRNYLNYLDRASWVDYHLLNVFTKNDDAFIFSEYFNKDVNGLLKAGPVWDYDRALGGADGRDLDPTQWNPVNVGDYWNISWWTYVTHDPDFMQAWVDRWQSLRQSLFSTSNLLAQIDGFAAQIGPAAAARDEARWPANTSRFAGGYAGEVANMKSWVSTRAQWIDAQFVAAPNMVATASTFALTPAAGTKIAYTTDGSDPRLSGGAISPLATLTSNPVSLTTAQSFTARSYNIAMLKSYPGSPWSSPITEISSTTGLTGQIADVSCRTLVGTGANILIAGFVITGPAGVPKEVLIRGVGPGIAQFGVTGVLAQPVLSVWDKNGNMISSNTGWGNNANAAVLAAITPAVGTFSLGNGSADSALLVSLTPDAYTVHVSGVAQSTGNALVEIYQVAQNGAAIVDVSSRALVNAASGPLITGFVTVGGTSQMLVRGDGPGLLKYGVTSVLAQPVLQVFDANGKLIASNTGWGTNSNTAQIAAAAASVGAFPLADNSADSALLLTLPAGAYTVQVSGAAGSSGDTLAECYLVPAH